MNRIVSKTRRTTTVLGVCTLSFIMSLAPMAPLNVALASESDVMTSSPLLRTERALEARKALTPLAPLAVITVNTTDDEDNTNLANCSLREAIVAANGDTPFGGCIAGSGGDLINFSVTGTITLTSALPSLSTSVQIEGPGASQLTVSGDNSVRVFRVALPSPGTVSFAGLTIANGSATMDVGGGIYNDGNATVNVNNCVITNNFAVLGGGLANSGVGTFTVTNSTLSDNTANTAGGAVNLGTLNLINSTLNNNSAGGAGSGNGGGINTGSLTLNVINSTLSNNSAEGGGGAIFNSGVSGTVNVTSSTLTGNSADVGGGINSPFGGVPLIRNSIIALNTATTSGPDLSGPFTTQGFNFIGENDGAAASFPAGNPNANGDIVGTSGAPLDPLLGPLAGNGGPTQTHRLLTGSPAIDRGKNFAVDENNNPIATDQRGVTRPVDLDDPPYPNAAGGDASDIGAYELQGDTVQNGTPSFIVNTPDDHDDGDCTDGDCTLREAIIAANFDLDLSTITFNITGAGPHIIQLTMFLDDLETDMNIKGPADESVQVRGESIFNPYSIFTIVPGAVVNISNLTITDGAEFIGGGILNCGSLVVSNTTFSNNLSEFGGAISNCGSLTVKQSTFTYNFAEFGGAIDNLGSADIKDSTFTDNLAAVGGAIYNGNTLNIENSTFTANHAFEDGGAIDSDDGNLTIVNSTISGNTSDGDGGGLFQCGVCGSSTGVLTNVTITGNRADADDDGYGVGGGINNFSGVINLSNNIVGGNFNGESGTTVDDIDGPMDPASSFNLIGNGGSGGLQDRTVDPVHGNQVGVTDPGLGPLQDNGGPTHTHALVPGSLAIDAGNSSLTTDQRGKPRPIDDLTVPNAASGNATDIGAYELQTVTPSADLEIVSKTDSPDPVIAGNNIIYTIKFRNNGPNDSLNVQVRENIPANTTLVSATVTEGTGWTVNDESCCTSSIFFSKSLVANGETATFTVIVKVLPSTPSGSVITNQVTAGSFEPGFTPDPPPDTNNKATATTNVVTAADVSVAKIDSTDPVLAGQNLTYTITLTNSGPSDAQNLSLSDPLPPGTTLVSFMVPGGWTRTDGVAVGGTGTVTATAPTVAAGANAVFTLVVNVNAATPHNTVLTNSATATTTTGDSTPENNTGTATTTVESEPDLTITKTHAGNFSQGQTDASYTIIVSNSASGPTNGSTVTVIDVVPVGLTPTGPIGAHNGWTCSIMDQTLTCTRNDVLNGNSSYPAITLTVNVANPAPLTVTNRAVVSGGGEINTTNNTATDVTNINCIANPAQTNNNPLVISRFRMNGPRRATDEFIEIFNPTDETYIVATGNCTGGLAIFSSAGNGTASNAAQMVCQIPNGTQIAARGYFLCTGATYTLNNLGLNGGAAGATSTGDAPIGCGGTCKADIPDDAGLALLDVGNNIVGLCTKGGFGCPTGFNYSSIEASGAAKVYDAVGFSPYGQGAPAPEYPSLAANFCEGQCLKPVGDASIDSSCPESSIFPVIEEPPGFCYGQAGQYEFLRRQTTFSPTVGTLHQDTNNNVNDILLVAPNPGTNMGLSITGVLGVTAMLGAAGPQNSHAPADFPRSRFTQAPFDGPNQLAARNAERNYNLDPTVANPANDPQGTFALRLRFTNNSGRVVTGLRFRVDNISTVCGPESASTVGTADAKNLSSTPDCGAGGFTAILKLLNSVQEVVVDSTDTAYAVHGTVIEDLSATATPTPPDTPPNFLSPFGGGVDNSVVANPSSSDSSVGNGVIGGTGVFSTLVGDTEVLRIKVKFGVVRSGRFILLITPAAKTGP